MRRFLRFSFVFSLWTAILMAAPVYLSGRVTTPDGATIAYHVRDAAGPNLVLIPGSWGDYRVYDRLVEKLDPHLRVVIVELRGHGQSQPPTLTPSMGLFAEDVLRVTDALQLDRFFVGGHSIGGMLAIEIGGRRPAQVAGVISLEGWAHHTVQKDAFGADKAPLLTAAEEAQNKANRARVLGKLTAQETAAFAAVWRSWDGGPILESIAAPVLEVWGDRGQPRPSRKTMHIPERGNIELVWMAGSSHSLLIQRPGEVAAAINGFVSRQPEARKMFAAPGLRIAGETADFGALPRVEAELITIYRAVEGKTGFNMHPYIAFHDGRFWAMWSSNKIRDLQAGQYVRYATSVDGVKWSESALVTPSEEAANFRYFARGFWQRDGELIALAARDEAVRPLFGPGLELRGYRWTGSGWSEPFVVAKDTINNFPPGRLANGKWLMARRDHKMRSSMLMGGARSTEDWTTLEMPKPETDTVLDEPVWWTLPNGMLSVAFRDGGKSRRLYRSFSRDGGMRWDPPLKTDFPDAMAKFNVLRLSSGWYAMASSPNPNGKRIPLCLSLSKDGVVFTRMGVLREAPTMYRYGGKEPGYAGYHYPQLLEKDGDLYIIHAENMEDIRLLRIRRAELERLAR